MRYTLLLAMVVLMSATMQAQQKLGYINVGNLLVQMPAVKQADKNLENLKGQLISKGETMARSFQTKYQNYAKKIQGGGVAPVRQAEMQKELQTEQAKIEKYEQDVIKQLAKKRETLLKPIINKINTAINAVAKEKGYQLIFDISGGSFMYVDEATDVTALVKAKLGM